MSQITLPSFPAWLQAQGVDEATMGLAEADHRDLSARELQQKREDRRRQLLSFHQAFLTEPAAPVAHDAAGAELKVGDTVTITLKVTGVHAIPDDFERGLKGRMYLNLARLADGVELHQFNYESSLVKKV